MRIAGVITCERLMRMGNPEEAVLKKRSYYKCCFKTASLQVPGGGNGETGC
jgi:hypothetical protein